MEAWRRKKGLMRAPKFTTIFDPMEREVLGDLTATVAEALIQRAQSAPKDPLAEMIDMPTGHKDAPEDPSLARLLPDFEREDDEEFEGDRAMLRSFHETDIIKAKLENLQLINTVLGPTGGVEVTLDEAEAHQFVAALNDLRLYVAAEEHGGEGAEMDRKNLVEWMGFCQESLLEALMGA
ncbi:DUF2017 domain-containing protein [Corynebacterium breve]|uniref:DUF2017 domain-containing protein n=1 Tax=Corynebacterium breve TaxID=3049799 RepID=A0ABY8VF45_9CORY|nr:DUF2017 domain-containing protein [Corynebacterium breve]WIM67253.1 DUF2017 domain-containing protein [Corynebacterium breve]